MSYRKEFLGATDPVAYTAIRNKYDGGVESLPSGMVAGIKGLELGVTADNGFEPGGHDGPTGMT